MIGLIYRSSHPEVFLEKGVLKICNKLTEEHLCRSVISIKLLCNFIEITLRHGCSPVNLLHIFRAPFTKNTSERLLLNLILLYHVIRSMKVVFTHVYYAKRLESCRLCEGGQETLSIFSFKRTRRRTCRYKLFTPISYLFSFSYPFK